MVDVIQHTIASLMLSKRANNWLARAGGQKELCMNEIQKKVLIAVAAVVVAMLLYPPCYTTTPSRVYSGYDWIFNRSIICASVDIGLLVVQWLGVLIVGGIAFAIFKSK